MPRHPDACWRWDRLAKRRRPARILDMGTGTGILAIAAAKMWRVPVVAADLDLNSVRVAAENMRLNSVSSLVRCIPSDGYRAPAISRNGPYDLILANILARPLSRMAPRLARNLAPGGVAILSRPAWRAGALCSCGSSRPGVGARRKSYAARLAHANLQKGHKTGLKPSNFRCRNDTAQITP